MHAPGEARSALARLLAVRPITGAKWGLERIEYLLDALGRPERTFHSLQIGGTNGKGSAASVASTVLGEAGFRTGLYTSPHLISFPERIQIDGDPVSAAALEAASARISGPADACGASYFEVATALAVLCFADAGVEIAVIETGLGGRLDATSALGPIVTGITSVSRDHTDLLGETLERIAAEKAGILKPGVPTVLGPVSGEVAAVVEDRARTLRCPLQRIGREIRVEEIRVALHGTSFLYRSVGFREGLELRTGLVGVHQAYNAAVAVAMLEALPTSPTVEQLRDGLARARPPGRFQVVQRPDGPWLLDIAHNEAAVQALGDTLERTDLPSPRVALLSILRDKRWPAMVAAVSQWAERIVLTSAPSAPDVRRWDPAAVVTSTAVAGMEPCADFDRALDRSRELAGAGTVVVTGSAYTVGDALLRLRADDGSPLRNTRSA